MNLLHTRKLLTALFAMCFLLTGCEKEDAMVVDRVASPVLITIAGTSFAASETVKVTATVYQLDKSGILDHTVGIDSLPVANLALRIVGNGIPLGDFTTDAAGKVNLTKTWSELGYASPQKGNAVQLEWSGSYKGQPFSKLSQVQVK
ncbi:hypothetical protein ACXYMU_06270 [Pontibacter sp. CAU 1760]